MTFFKPARGAGPCCDSCFPFAECKSPHAPANKPLVTDGQLSGFRFAEPSLLDRPPFTSFGRGGRLSYSGEGSGRGTTAGR